MTGMRNFFSTFNFSAPQLILKILLDVNHSVNITSYVHYVTKMLTNKPTPYLTLTLTSAIGAEKKVVIQDISS